MANAPSLSTLDAQLTTFARCKSQLLQEGHRGKFVLIYGERVEGVFESRDQGLVDGYRRFGNVPFLVREVADRTPPRATRAIGLVGR